MEKRTLGNSHIEFPVVTFGAWAGGGWDWGGSNDDQTIRAIHAALDHGVTAIDTAPVYGAGHSETVVGQAIKGRRDQIVLATKCGFRWDIDHGQLMNKKTPEGTVVPVRRCLKKESIFFEIEQSLNRLQTDYIDLYQCHAPDADTPLEETMEALMQLRDSGKIRAFGVSNFSPEQLSRCSEISDLSSTQSMYNLVLRDTEKDLLPICHENNLGVLTYTSMLLGLLSGKVSAGREFPDGDLRKGHHLFTPEWRQEIQTMLQKFDGIAEKYRATYAQLAVAWVVASKGITTALVGARNEQQAIDNAAAGLIKLTADEYQLMTKASDDLRAKMFT